MIYTQTGDKGTTSLVGGSRVRKDDVRVEAYGTVDELNSHIGLLAEMLRQHEKEAYAELKNIQHQLFTIQTLLATEDESLRNTLPALPAEEVKNLEHQIDKLESGLPRIRYFIVAGGCIAGAQAHICRTVCRRAERRVVSLAAQSPIDGQILQYMNRLSDYLFVLARHIVVASGNDEDLYIS